MIVRRRRVRIEMESRTMRVQVVPGVTQPNDNTIADANARTPLSPAQLSSPAATPTSTPDQKEPRP